MVFRTLTVVSKGKLSLADHRTHRTLSGPSAAKAPVCQRESHAHSLTMERGEESLPSGQPCTAYSHRTPSVLVIAKQSLVSARCALASLARHRACVRGRDSAQPGPLAQQSPLAQSIGKRPLLLDSLSLSGPQRQRPSSTIGSLT